MYSNVLCTALTVLSLGLPANGAVHIFSSVEDDAATQVFDGGDLLPIAFYLEHDGNGAVFGGEFSLAVATRDLQIHSVSFNSAFSKVIGSEPALPGPFFRSSRAQSLRAIDRTLGADSAPLHFATVELEVLNSQHFESALLVKAKGAVLRAPSEARTRNGPPPMANDFSEIRIEIINTRQPDASVIIPMQPQAVDRAPWTVQQAPATLDIRPVGDGAPVTVLAANTEYELHYRVGTEGNGGNSVNGFDLFLTVDSPDTAAEVAFCWDGATVMDLPTADSSEEAPTRQAISADLIWPAETRESQPENRNSDGDSHLCSFTTGSAGTLRFDLHLYDIHPTERLTVEMLITAEFTVE